MYISLLNYDLVESILGLETIQGQPYRYIKHNYVYFMQP